MNTLKHILCIGALWCLAITASAIDFPTYQPQPIGSIHSPVKQRTTNQPIMVDNPKIVNTGFTMTSTSSYAPKTVPVYGSNSPSRGPRRIPGYDGTEEGDGAIDGGGEGWIWEEEEWIRAEIGDVAYVDGGWKQWNGIAWVELKDQDEPGTPIGSLPVLLMLLLCAGYVWTKKRKEANLA